MNNIGTSYLLWLACLFQFHGLHRFYNKKYATGLLWFCTFGLFGIGQFVDLFLMPKMVEEHNINTRARLGFSEYGVPLTQAEVTLTIPKSPTHEELKVQVIRDTNVVSDSKKRTFKPSREELKVQIVKAAAARGGKISTTQAVMDTGSNFVEVESALKEMVKSGYVVIDNHPVTGVVIYDFVEL